MSFSPWTMPTPPEVRRPVDVPPLCRRDLPNGTRLHFAAPFQQDVNWTIQEIFESQVYHRAGFDLRPTDIVVDVGAHVGVFAHWALPQLPQGRLICVEPTTAADHLEHSLAQNNLRNVRLHRVAMGRSGSTLELWEHPEAASLNRARGFRIAIWLRLNLALLVRRGRFCPPRLRTFPCWSLADLLAQENLTAADLLKMDCEGGEHDLLAAASDADLRRFPRIMMEFHHFHPSHRLSNLVNRLEKAGFTVEVSRPWLHHLLHKTGMLWALRHS